MTSPKTIDLMDALKRSLAAPAFPQATDETAALYFVEYRHESREAFLLWFRDRFGDSPVDSPEEARKIGVLRAEDELERTLKAFELLALHGAARDWWYARRNLAVEGR